MRTTLACLLCMAFFAGPWLPAAAQEQPIPNLDLKAGAQGWTAWSGTTEHRWEVELGGGPDGGPALRIDAANATHNVMVMNNTRSMTPGQHYVMEIWWRIESVTASPEVDLRIIFRDATGQWLSGIDYYPSTSRREGDWVRSTYRVSAPEGLATASVGIWVRNMEGTVRAANMTIAPTEPGRRTFDSMYWYDPMQVELGTAPLRSFSRLQEADSPFLACSDRWNRLMIETACVQEDLSRARRLLLYTGQERAALASHIAAVEEMLEQLDALQQTYGRLYDAGAANQLPAEFDPPAERLEQRIAQAGEQLQALLNQLAADRAHPVQWRTVDRSEPWWDPETGRHRYLLWSRWSHPAFWEREAPLDMGPGATLTAGYPRSFVDGRADWSNYMDQWAVKGGDKASQSSLITHYALHDKGYLAPEFAAQHENDPELRMWDAEGNPMGTPAGVTQFNWLDPRVRGHMADVLTQMAEFFRDKPEFKFYVTAWESAGPYAQAERIGRNPSHTASFRAYLQDRYGSIADLNRRWGTEYESLEAISLVPEEPVPAGRPSTPRAIESQRWAHEAYADFIAHITATIRAEDPTKPVVGQHSTLMDRAVSPRVAESVDIFGYHNRNPRTMAMMVYLASLERYTGRPTSLFENFWSCQEDHPRRLSDERAMRAQMRRYLHRHAVWGRAIQVWWYAYTSAPYLLTYNGNWFNPVYDLTTFRYSAAGFPVEKRKIDRFESLLLDSEIVPARAVLVQPYATMLAQGAGGASWREWLAWHEMMFARNLFYEALPETFFEADRAELADFDLVILPFASHLSDAFAGRLLAFLKRGGTVVASGPPGLYDELGLPAGALLQTAAPRLEPQPNAEPERGWEYTFAGLDSPRGWVEARVGDGRLVVLTRSVVRLAEHHDSLAEVLRAAAEPVAAAPETTFELLVRRLPDGSHLLCVLNTDPDHATEGDIAVRGSFAHVLDIDLPTAVSVPARVEDGWTRFRTMLDPGGTAFFLLKDVQDER
ncbi:MAG: beta-galactosidase [Thermoguttaceae bacterium]|nr:beta-galactosidase [Thermoguttaceae bacterium]